MNRLPVIIGASVVVLAVVISILVIVLPNEEPSEANPSRATGDHDFFTVPEKPRTDDSKTFKPDWN